MISEVLQLGIKGADLVIRQLAEIQKRKKLLTQALTVRADIAAKIRAGGDKQPAVADRLARMVNPSAIEADRKKEETEKKKAEDEKQSAIKESQNNVRSAVGTVGGLAASAGGLDVKGLITGIGHAFDVWTVGVSGLIAEMAGAAISFKDRIKQAATEFADTADATNTAQRFTGEKGFLKDQRSDISRNEQRGIIEALGSNYGKMSAEFKDALRTLYGSNQNGKAYDVKETTALASGNFESLGTDQGFFMQKIANSLQSLPPSAKQKMMPQLFEMIPKEDRAEQTDLGARQTVTTFDDMARNKSEELGSNGANVGRAVQIQSIQDSIETGLAASVDGLITALNKAAEGIGEGARKVNENIQKAQPKRSLLDF